jgi:hypothetical protein
MKAILTITSIVRSDTCALVESSRRHPDKEEITIYLTVKG